MSLLSANITRAKKLSLREVKLPSKQIAREPTTPLPEPKKPATEEDIIYSKLVAENPAVERLVEVFDLVSEKTGKPLKLVDLPADASPEEPATEPSSPKAEVDVDKLFSLAQRAIQPENSYTEAEVIQGIIQATNVSQQRAETGFNLMLKAGALERAADRYYLKDSTPF